MLKVRGRAYGDNIIRIRWAMDGDEKEDGWPELVGDKQNKH